MNNEQDLKKRTIKTLDQDRNVKGTEGSIIVCSNEGEGIKQKKMERVHAENLPNGRTPMMMIRYKFMATR